MIEYATHHVDDDEQQEKDEKQDSADIEPWDREFINVDQGTLYELICAANYLDLKGLLLLGCKTVANMMKNQSVDAIRAKFGIVNDLTPEQVEQLKKENSWSYEV